MVAVMLIIGTLSSMGYGVLSFIQIFGMACLDFFDFLTNSVMMPLAALATCFLIVRTVGFDKIAREIEQSSAFKRKKLYMFFMKYLAPICRGNETEKILNITEDKMKNTDGVEIK